MEDIILKSFKFDTTNLSTNHEGMRTFTCWGSVEVLDRQKEVIPITELYNTMDIWMARGAPIMFNHTNYQVGKGLNWRPELKNGIPGVLITGLIFDHYSTDKMVWDGIKKGDFEGLSIGGFGNRARQDNGTSIVHTMTTHEFSIVPRCGNQESTWVNINAMAKSMMESKETMEPTKVNKEDSTGYVAPPQGAPELSISIGDIVKLLQSLSERMDSMEAMIAAAPTKEEEPEPTPMTEEKAVEEEKPQEEEPKKEEKADDAKEEEEKPEKEEDKKDDEEDLKKNIQKNTELAEITKTLQTLREEKESLVKQLEDIKKNTPTKVVVPEQGFESVAKTNPLHEEQRIYTAADIALGRRKLDGSKVTIQDVIKTK